MSVNLLGQTLHAIRKRQGLTLKEVGVRTGISLSTLSRVENGETSLTYDKLVRLAQGLEVDISAFFNQPEAPATVPVTARRSIDSSQGERVVTAKYLYRYLNTDLSNKKLVPMIVENLVHSLEEFGALHRHSGEEFVFVLSGVVDVHTEFYSPSRLHAGESMYFDSNMGHAYTAVGDKPCRLLTIMTAPDAHGAHSLPPPAVAAERRKSSAAGRTRARRGTAAHKSRKSTR